MYKTRCSKTIGFVMLFWHETTLCIFEVVPFQTLLITLLDCCMYTKVSSKTIGVVMFLWNETILFLFCNGFISKNAYKIHEFCIYNKVCPQTIGFVQFLEMNSLYVCLKWFNFKVCLSNLKVFDRIKKGVPKPWVS